MLQLGLFEKPGKKMNKNVVNLHFQVDEEPLCGCATCKSLFIYLSQTNHKETTQSLSNELPKTASHHTAKKEKKKRKKQEKSGRFDF